MSESPPHTESIKYAGSKLKLLPQIIDLIKQTGARSVFDGFSGSTRVAQALAQLGMQMVINDVAIWSRVLGTTYLLNRQEPDHYQNLLDHLNAAPPEDGWFTELYGGDITNHRSGNAIQADGLKRPWQRKNTRKLDAIRAELDRLKLDEVSFCVALTSLMLALDQVDSSLGHFSSYLRNWSPRSSQDLHLRMPNLWVNKLDHQVCQGDVFEIVPTMKADLAYYDPPYGSNNEKMPPSRVRYAAYYHLWTTLCRNDRPEVFGKAARRKDTSDRLSASVFEEFRKNAKGEFIAVEALDRLLQKTQCEWILLSYSSGGRATSQALNEMIQRHGELVKVVEAKYQKNVMASMRWTNEWLKSAETPHREFLFLIRK